MNTTLNLRRTISTFGGLMLATTMITTATADITEHDTQIACYASVHAQCYGNGANNCSDDDYDWGLDQCDSIYESGQISRPAPGRLAAKRADNPKFRSVLKRNLRK